MCTGRSSLGTDFPKGQPRVRISIVRPTLEDKCNIALPCNAQVRIRCTTSKHIAHTLPEKAAIRARVNGEVGAATVIIWVAKIEHLHTRCGWRELGTHVNANAINCLRLFLAHQRSILRSMWMSIQSGDH